MTPNARAELRERAESYKGHGRDEITLDLDELFSLLDDRGVSHAAIEASMADVRARFGPLSDSMIVYLRERIGVHQGDERLPHHAGAVAPSSVVECRCPSCDEPIPPEHLRAIIDHHGL